MSATPQRTRVRMVTAGHGDMRVGVEDLLDEAEYKEGQPLVVLDANAFAALLAVARDAQWCDDECHSLDSVHKLGQTLNALDAAHPEWRSWTP